MFFWKKKGDAVEEQQSPEITESLRVASKVWWDYVDLLAKGASSRKISLLKNPKNEIREAFKLLFLSAISGELAKCLRNKSIPKSVEIFLSTQHKKDLFFALSALPEFLEDSESEVGKKILALANKGVSAEHILKMAPDEQEALAYLLDLNSDINRKRFEEEKELEAFIRELKSVEK